LIPYELTSTKASSKNCPSNEFSKIAKSAPELFLMGAVKVKTALPPSPRLTTPPVPDFPKTSVTVPAVVFTKEVSAIFCQPLSIIALVAQATKTDESL